MTGNGEDFNALASRMSVWHAAAAEIPNEREIIHWPVEGTDAARAVRLGELYGRVMEAIASGHTDVSDELARVIACCTLWMEDLLQR